MSDNIPIGDQNPEDSDYNQEVLSATVGSTEGNPRASSTPLPPGTSRSQTPTANAFLNITTDEELEERVIAIVGRRFAGVNAPKRARVEASTSTSSEETHPCVECQNKQIAIGALEEERVELIDELFVERERREWVEDQLEVERAEVTRLEATVEELNQNLNALDINSQALREDLQMASERCVQQSELGLQIYYLGRAPNNSPAGDDARPPANNVPAAISVPVDNSMPPPVGDENVEAVGDENMATNQEKEGDTVVVAGGSVSPGNLIIDESRRIVDEEEEEVIRPSRRRRRQRSESPEGSEHSHVSSAQSVCSVPRGQRKKTRGINATQHKTIAPYGWVGICQEVESSEVVYSIENIQTEAPPGVRNLAQKRNGWLAGKGTDEEWAETFKAYQIGSFLGGSGPQRERVYHFGFWRDGSLGCAACGTILGGGSCARFRRSRIEVDHISVGHYFEDMASDGSKRKALISLHTIPQK